MTYLTTTILALVAAICQPVVNILAPPVPDTGGTLTIQLPAELKARSATAGIQGQKSEQAGSPQKSSVQFTGINPDQRWDINIALESGQILQGIDLGWYAAIAKPGEPKPLTDDDRDQIRSIVQDVKDFYNQKHILLLAGDADRAVALVRLLRDTDFYDGKGQIVWRIELWYFENQAGGWAAVRQQQKVVRRERFKDADAYKKATEPLRFVGKLGGVTVATGKTNTITLTKEEIDDAPSGYIGPEKK